LIRIPGESTTIGLNKANRNVGIRFEVPPQSLVTAVHYPIFVDLLIGNFMKTTFHGVQGLYPDFSPYVAKYADNGGAETKEELREYFHHYRSRDPIGYIFRRREQSPDTSSSPSLLNFTPRPPIFEYRFAQHLCSKSLGALFTTEKLR